MREDKKRLSVVGLAAGDVFDALNKNLHNFEDFDVVLNELYGRYNRAINGVEEQGRLEALYDKYDVFRDPSSWGAENIDLIQLLEHMEVSVMASENNTLYAQDFDNLKVAYHNIYHNAKSVEQRQDYYKNSDSRLAAVSLELDKIKPKRRRMALTDNAAIVDESVEGEKRNKTTSSVFFSAVTRNKSPENLDKIESKFENLELSDEREVPLLKAKVGKENSLFYHFRLGYYAASFGRIQHSISHYEKEIANGFKPIGASGWKRTSFFVGFGVRSSITGFRETMTRVFKGAGRRNKDGQITTKIQECERFLKELKIGGATDREIRGIRETLARELAYDRNHITGAHGERWGEQQQKYNDKKTITEILSDMLVRAMHTGLLPKNKNLAAVFNSKASEKVINDVDLVREVNDQTLRKTSSLSGEMPIFQQEQLKGQSVTGPVPEVSSSKDSLLIAPEKDKEEASEALYKDDVYSAHTDVESPASALSIDSEEGDESFWDDPKRIAEEILGYPLEESTAKILDYGQEQNTDDSEDVEADSEDSEDRAALESAKAEELDAMVDRVWELVDDLGYSDQNFQKTIDEAEPSQLKQLMFSLEVTQSKRDKDLDRLVDLAYDNTEALQSGDIDISVMSEYLGRMTRVDTLMKQQQNGDPIAPKELAPLLREQEDLRDALASMKSGPGAKG